MMLNGRQRSPAAKLGAYGVILTLALGGGALAGATLGPDPSTDDANHDDDHASEATMNDSTPTPAPDPLPAGLAVSRSGYTLDLRTPTVDAGEPAELSFVIEGPDGQPVTAYEVEHDKELHLVVVSRDLARYAHLHPTRDAAGLWSVTAPSLAPGSYRVFTDFAPAGHDGLTLGADLTVPGDHRPVERPAPSPVVGVDGYDVTFDGELVAGTDSALTVTVTRAGEPVTDLQPYLGALGHLVVIRDGDLAYLHVHPLDTAVAAGGPEVRFAVAVPTDGAYGLYFDFAHDGEVRTAMTTAVATVATGDTAGPPAHDAHGD